MPALLKTASTAPRASACSNAASTWRESATSVGTARAVAPLARHSCVAASNSSSGSATSATAAPSCASLSAVARPIPELAPVTRATRLAKRDIVTVCSPYGAVAEPELSLRRQQEVRIEAGVVAGVAGGAHLVDLEQHGVAVAIQPHRVHVLRVSRRLALDPVLLPGARIVGRLAGFQRAGQGKVVHPRHHQH